MKEELKIYLIIALPSTYILIRNMKSGGTVMFDDFMTADVLTTFTGLTAAVIVIVQFTKSLIKRKFGDHFVRLYTFIIALILTFIFARQDSNIEGIVLTVINAMVITIGSMGGYELLADPLAQSIRKK